MVGNTHTTNMSDVIKQDLNFLEHPLWFQVSHSSKENTEWRDTSGYLYRAGYKAPDQLDMLFLLYMLMCAQQNNYAPHQEFSRYEILKKCGCPINTQYVKRLEDSLKRWLHVSIEFQGSFYDGKNYLSMGFHILDHYCIRDSDKRVEIVFNPHYLQQLRQSSFFKYIHFNTYKILRRPVTRRLFELLVHQFKQRKQWSIELCELGQKLTLYTRRKRGEDKGAIYPSDVLTAIKPAINEINRLATHIDRLIELGIDPQEIPTVAYEVIGKERRMIQFRKIAPLVENPKTALHSPQAISPPPAEPRIQELTGYLKNQTKAVCKIVTDAYYQYGYDYVKWHIFYANRKGYKNYAHYLQLALQHNWAQEFREEYERLVMADDSQTPHEILNHPMKIETLVKIAQKADFVVLPDGQKFKIRQVFPNGAIEIVHKDFHMNLILPPEKAYACRFECKAEIG